MVDVTIESGNAIFEVEGAHKFWALTSRLVVPLEHIVSVAARTEDAKSWWHGWKIAGADIPGMFAAGLFKFNGKWVFWDVRNPESSIEIELSDERYKELILEVRDPDSVVKLIQDAIGRR